MSDQAILPPPLKVEVGGIPPPAPVDYDDGFVLPEHCVKPLQTLHSHPLDARLEFFAVPHVYTFDGVPTSASVTALAHQFEKPFDGPSAIQSMKTGKKQAWPRLEYVRDAQPSDGSTLLPHGRGALAVLDGKTIAVCHPHSLAPSSNVIEFLETVRVKGVDWTDEVEVFTFDRPLTDDEILAMWSKNGRMASNKGTDAHYLAELFFNGLTVRECAEVDIVRDFVRTHLVPRGILAHNTEKEIVCKDADLAGSIDLILYDPQNDVYHIVDHKRSDKLKMQLRGYGKMNAPFKHLDDCKGAGYALQTSIYQYILERDYGMKIGERVLLSLHPDQPFATSVPYLQAEVEYIMQQRFDLVRTRRAVADEHPDLVCSLTGAPLVDAVRLATGEWAMEKAAVVRDLVFTRDDAVRRRFEDLVLRSLPPAPVLDPLQCLSWKKLMPQEGLVPFGGW